LRELRIAFENAGDRAVPRQFHRRRRESNMVRHDKMAGIDQGNGPIARHAHASSLNVRRGAWSYADKALLRGTF
ncbi:MAG: hypothetical protein ACM34F_12080, partial [Betaproteobacteria bacterium]